MRGILKGEPTRLCDRFSVRHVGRWSVPEHQLQPEYPWVTVPVPESGSPGVQSAGDMAGSKEFGFGHSKLEVPMNHLNQGWQIFPVKR